MSTFGHFVLSQSWDPAVLLLVKMKILILKYFIQLLFKKYYCLNEMLPSQKKIIKVSEISVLLLFKKQIFCVQIL